MYQKAKEQAGTNNANLADIGWFACRTFDELKSLLPKIHLMYEQVEKCEQQQMRSSVVRALLDSNVALSYFLIWQVCTVVGDAIDTPEENEQDAIR